MKIVSYADRVWSLATALAAIMLLASAAASAADPPATGTPDANRPSIKVFKLSTCGCCRTWVKYLEASGFPVEVTDVNELTSVRAEHGIPEALAGCHTALVGGYVLEGHVSVEEIERLLAQRPMIKGLLVTGMPKGSPGMAEPGFAPYDVLALQPDGSTAVFATHQAPPETADAGALPEPLRPESPPEDSESISP